MRRQSKVLLATADPLLNHQLARMAGVTVVLGACETTAECLEQSNTEDVEWVLVSPALSPVPGTLASLVAELGARQPGVHCLVLAQPDQLSQEEIQAIRAAGGRVVGMPTGPVPHLKALLQNEVDATSGQGFALSARPDTGQVLHSFARPDSHPGPVMESETASVQTLDLSAGRFGLPEGEQKDDLRISPETVCLDRRAGEAVYPGGNEAAGQWCNQDRGLNESLLSECGSWSGGAATPAEEPEPAGGTEPLSWQPAGISALQMGRPGMAPGQARNGGEAPAGQQTQLLMQKVTGQGMGQERVAPASARAPWSSFSGEQLGAPHQDLWQGMLQPHNSVIAQLQNHVDPGAPVSGRPVQSEAPRTPGDSTSIRTSVSPLRRGVEGRAVLLQRVVAFWGGKPGTGRSTLLVAVSDLISRMPGVRVCSVDLNPQNSSLAPLLQKESEPNSWWRLGEALLEANLTPQAVRESLITIRPGWSLLSGPAGSDQWCALLTGRVVADLVALLRAEFDYILLDLPAGRGPVADAGFAHAQQVILTVSAFFPDVVDTARQFQQLLADGIASRDRCSLVLCPWIESADLPSADVGACLGLPVSATVPLVPALAMAAARTGRPITQWGSAEARSYTQAAAAIAALITGRSIERPQRRIWFGR